MKHKSETRRMTVTRATTNQSHPIGYSDAQLLKKFEEEKYL